MPQGRPLAHLATSGPRHDDAESREDNDNHRGEPMFVEIQGGKGGAGCHLSFAHESGREMAWMEPSVIWRICSDPGEPTWADFASRGR